MGMSVAGGVLCWRRRVELAKSWRTQVLLTFEFDENSARCVECVISDVIAAAMIADCSWRGNICIPVTSKDVCDNPRHMTIVPLRIISKSQ